MLWGTKRWEYACVYIIAELLVFSAMLPLLHGATYYCRQRGAAILFGLLVGDGLAYLATRGHVHGLYQWIGMVESGLLMAFAIPTAIGAAYLEGTQRRIAQIFMVMWFALAAFHFGWTRNMNSALWHRLGYVVPTACVAIGSLWLVRVDAHA